MDCVHCGNEIPEGHGFCSKCGTRAKLTKPAVRTGFVVALLVVFFAGSALMVYLFRADQSAANMQPNTPQLRTYTESIDTALSVPPLQRKVYRFDLPPAVKDAAVQGRFTATGGARNDIEVWVMNDDSFVNWQNGHPVTPLYSSGRVTRGNLNLSLREAGTYYLVFDNRFSVISPKAIQDNVILTYKQ